MLIGEYSHSLDGKGRFIMPQKFRQDLGASFVLCKGFDDNCLFAYSVPEWEKLTSKIENLPLARRREVVRFIFSGAADVQPDSQGRVLIPAALREYASIKKDITVIGAADHAEIWDCGSWNAQSGKFNPQMITDIMQELEL